MRVKDKLQSLNVRPSKKRGQNFVIEPRVIEAIVEFGDPQPEEALVELGPGLGALTEALADRQYFSVVEIEPSLCEDLRLRFPQIQVIEGDARSFDFSSVGTALTVFGNLPYVFSTDIVFQLLSYSRILTRAVLLLQREFAERLAAEPGGKEYGRLSIACQLRADVRLGPVIDGRSFHPPTEVMSQLVELRFLKEPRVAVPDLVFFEKVVKAAFLKRRKKIINSLNSSGFDDFAALESAFKSSAIDPGRRAETLSIEEFAMLTLAISREQGIE